jgi:curved DNA-binding protein CbpA
MKLEEETMARRCPRPDPYEALGIRRDASSADIARAYRRRARELHPDSHPVRSDAADQFHAASAAYELLSDPVRRAAYDQRARPGSPASAAAAPGRSEAEPRTRPAGNADPAPGRFSPPPPTVWAGPVRIEPWPDQPRDAHDDVAVWIADVLQAWARRYRPW